VVAFSARGPLRAGPVTYKLKGARYEQAQKDSNRVTIPITATRSADPATLPARYILITEGACLEPDIPNGSKVVVERDEKSRR
jgi:hypothetical protein